MIDMYEQQYIQEIYRQYTFTCKFQHCVSSVVKKRTLICNNNNMLYLHDHTSTYSIAKVIYNYILRIRNKI